MGGKRKPGEPHPRQKKRAKRVDGCDQCGKAHRRVDGKPTCIGHRAGKPDEPCMASPRKGATVCGQHGGRATQVQRRAMERVALMSAEGEIADLMRACDVPEQHPIDGLLECVRVAGAMMRVLSHKVGSLKEDPSIQTFVVEGKKGGSPETVKIAAEDGFWGVNHMGDQTPHVFLPLLRTWQEAYAKACKMALDAGIDERRLRLAEATGDGLYEAVQEALASINLSPTQQQAFTLALAAALRARTGAPLALEAG